jgi:hypothetical protein
MIKPILKKVFLIIEKIIYKLFGLILIQDMKLLNRHRIFSIINTERPWDYVRYSSLELAASEIHKKGIKGNVAEVGV